jgi:hypothetical protein
MFDIHRVELDWGGRKLILETGKIARQADGAVVATYGERKLLATVVAAKEPKEGIDFLPLPPFIRSSTPRAASRAAISSARPSDRARTLIAPDRPPHPSAVRRWMARRR